MCSKVWMCGKVCLKTVISEASGSNSSPANAATNKLTKPTVQIGNGWSSLCHKADLCTKAGTDGFD